MANSTYFWSDADKELLTKAYREGGGLSEAVELLPTKSRSTLAAQACRMKLTTPRPRKSKAHEEPRFGGGFEGGGACSFGGTSFSGPGFQSSGACSFGN